MALPKFTTTPTPLYQQQPIVKRQNYSELYLRSFAASEAATYNSFARISKRIDQIAANREKKREEKEKEQREENERKKNKFSRDTNIDRRLRAQASFLSSSGQGNALEIFAQEGDKLKAAYDAAENDPTGELWKDVAELENDIFGTVETFRKAMQSVERMREAAGEKDFDAIYSNFQPDGMYATLRNEIVQEQGYDVRLEYDENGKIVLAWTNHLKEESDEDYKQSLTLEQLAGMNLDDFGNKKINWESDDALGGQIFNKVFEEAMASKNPDLLNAYRIPGEKTVTNQRSLGSGSIEIASQKVQRRGENERQLIINQAANDLNARLSPMYKAMIWNDEIAVGPIETHSNRAAQEVIELSNGELTEADTDALKAAIARYGNATPAERANDPVLDAMHNYLDTVTTSWAANKFYELKLAKDEKPLGDPDITIKTDFDDLTIAEANKVTFLNNLNDTLEIASDINTFKLSKGETSIVQQKLNQLADLGYDAFKNTRNDAELIGDELTILADGFTYTDKTQDYEIFSVLLKSKGFKISDEEAKKLYRSYVLDVKYQGQGGQGWYLMNGVERGYYANWLSTEKAKLQKSINAKISSRANKFN